MITQKVSENVFAYLDGGNTTALVFLKRVILVDAGKSLPVMVEIRKEIEEVTNKKVDTVILTHFHSDHTGAVPVFSDCTIVSSTLLLKKLKEAKRKPHKGYELVFPNKTFDNYLEISDGDTRLLIKQTGGHSDDSTYVYCPGYRVLAAGDNLIVNAYPFGGKGCNPDVWIQALEEYLTLDADYIIPGHGPVVGKDTVKEFLDYMVNVKKVMKKQIAEGVSKENVIKAAGEVKYLYTPQDTTREDYYRRWKEQYLKSWYSFWKKHKN